MHCKTIQNRLRIALASNIKRQQKIALLSCTDSRFIADYSQDNHPLCRYDNATYEQILNWSQAGANHHMIFYGDRHYPIRLCHIPYPPLILFAIGNISLIHQPQIAIIGGRNASISSQHIAQQLAGSLGIVGITITSGMAKGIDAVAAEGALDAKGRTIAVLGTGPDMIYPRQNQRLYERISQQGLF